MSEDDALKHPWAEPLMADMRQQIEKAQETAQLHVGFVHDVTPHAMYDMPGVAVALSWLEESGEVTAKVLWVPGPLLVELLATADKLRSEKFIAEMERIGG